MTRKILLLCNLSSGTGAASRSIFEIVRTLSENDCVVTVYPIIPSKGLTSEKIIEENPHYYDAFVVCGGDGTLNHVINTICKLDLDTPIGYVPFGSTNDFAKTLYRKDRVTVQEVCEQIIKNDPIAYDIGKINNEYFNYVAAFGAFTRVSYTTPQELKNIFGYGGYVLNTIASFPEDINYRRFARVIHDGIEEEGQYLAGFVSNSISVAGMKAPGITSSEIDDGFFEVNLIHCPENLFETAEITGAILGGNSEKLVSKFAVKNLEMYFEEEAAWTMDGEDGKNFKSVIITVLPKRIRIFARK